MQQKQYLISIAQKKVSIKDFLNKSAEIYIRAPINLRRDTVLLNSFTVILQFLRNF